jgi:hypothetical protein
MKRKLAVLIVGSLAVASTVQTARAENYGMAGCGLGAMAFKDQPGKIQILAATVNNIISPQTSAITSGTSNCYEEDSHAQASLFIMVNDVALRKDISRGNGETLASLSQILKCSDASKLGAQLQKNYQSIYPTNQVPAEEVTKSIDATIRQDSDLKKSCAIYG